MSICWTLVTVLQLILPPISQHADVKTTCEIPSVEAGDDATLTTYFDINFTNEESTDFTVTHFGHNATVSQVMMRCIFSNGDVECDNKTCCTWERHVTDVFRVYIHNVSKELEGKFWGFVLPADLTVQKYCNFTLKASTCPTHVINASNSHMACNKEPVTIGNTCTVTCSPGHYFPENHNSVTYKCVGKNKWSPGLPATSCEAYTCPTDSIIAANSHVLCNNRPVTIGQKCTVACNPGHYFQENQTSVTYTCVGKNKWSPEISVTSCEAQGQSANIHFVFLLILLPFVIAMAILAIKRCYKRKYANEDNANIQDEYRAQSHPLINFVKTKIHSANDPLLPIKPNQIQTAPRGDEKYWLECIKKWYPDLQSRTYFLPPFHFNRVQYCQQNAAGYLVPVPQIPENSDVCGDNALDSVMRCLHKLADNPQLTDNSQQTENPHHKDNHQQTEISQTTDNPQHKEVMMVISQLQFGKYLGEPSYAAATTLASQTNPTSEQLRPPYYDKGDCDILIIHKSLGLLMLQISSVGGNFSQKKMTKKKDRLEMKKVKQAIEHLNKAEVVLKNLTPEIKYITKIIVLPNISSSQLKRIINRNPSIEKFLCECLGAKSVADVVKLCLLKDQLSDNQTLSDINHSSIQALGEWWQHIKASTSGSSLTSSLYEQLVARFCGPTTTVEVHCVTAPRLNIRTLGEAVSETGERVVSLVLFPEQVDILNQSPPRAFLSGPPGTGKTIVLILQSLTWLQRGYDVHVVSTWYESQAATIIIEHQLQVTAETPTARSRVHRHQFDLRKDGQVESAVSCLKTMSKGKQLCVIADEAMCDVRKSFTEFCDQLIKEVPGAFIWGASMHHDNRPSHLNEVKLTSPLRSPPVVVREVMGAVEIKNKQVDDYTVNGVPVPTDGPPIKRIIHRGQSGHTGRWPRDCVKCGYEVARFLKELDVGRTGDSNDPPPLQYRDVLVLCVGDLNDDRVDSTMTSGLVRGLRECRVPVCVVKEGDEDTIRDMALGLKDWVMVASCLDVGGLERKVVVVEGGTDVFVRLYFMSRCTSQLVVIDYGSV